MNSLCTCHVGLADNCPLPPRSPARSGNNRIITAPLLSHASHPQAPGAAFLQHRRDRVAAQRAYDDARAREAAQRLVDGAEKQDRFFAHLAGVAATAASAPHLSLAEAARNPLTAAPATPPRPMRGCAGRRAGRVPRPCSYALLRSAAVEAMPASDEQRQRDEAAETRGGFFASSVSRGITLSASSPRLFLRRRDGPQTYTPGMGNTAGAQRGSSQLSRPPSGPMTANPAGGAHSAGPAGAGRPPAAAAVQRRPSAGEAGMGGAAQPHSWGGPSGDAAGRKPAPAYHASMMGLASTQARAITMNCCGYE